MCRCTMVCRCYAFFLLRLLSYRRCSICVIRFSVLACDDALCVCSSCTVLYTFIGDDILFDVQWAVYKCISFYSFAVFSFKFSFLPPVSDVSTVSIILFRYYSTIYSINIERDVLLLSFQHCVHLQRKAKIFISFFLVTFLFFSEYI